MTAFLTFFLLLLIGLFSSTLRRKFHFPWVIALVVGGMIIGPHMLNLFEPDDTTEFIGQLGLVFLMFMAGLETKLSSFRNSSKDLYLLAFINGFFPFLLGITIGYFLDYNLVTILMIGIVFVSSSIAVVIPTLESNKLFDLRIGKSVITTSILQDIASLLLLQLLLQEINPTTNIPLILFYPILIFTLIAARYLLPEVRKMLSNITNEPDDLFQSELRSIVFILVGTIVLFELLGLHSIMAGFFAGLVLSDSVTDKVLLGKIRAISYGIFIPTFFILIGINTDISSLFNLKASLFLATLIVGGSIISKFISGTLGAMIFGFSKTQALFFGSSSIPQLSTTLAVSFTANRLGIISDELSAAFVVLSIVSTVLGPFLMSRFSKESITITTKERVKVKLGGE